ncbi:unnamed protein product [Haemonchus placei]|uniref:Non-specific serine/threonine protein kinase n=1 Tax=Haemonchus placei TaxID=6290 RepID=A0A0N4X9D5_HAEPC|nr:unnamed protein product [Haemonchus placei]
MDGDLVARCLKFMRINDNRLIFPTTVNANPGKGNVRLEVAFIHLLEQFRRAYIMDQITKSSPVYDKLNTELGISDETDMLSVIVQKILTNLKYWATNEQILELSLSLLKDLSLGYTAVRKLFRLQEVQLLLSNHTAEHFVFLGQSVPYSTMKHRTVFYEALTRLLTIDLNDDEQLFEQFMQPLAATSRELTAIMTTPNYNGAVSQEELKRVVVGLCRDLRGVAVACTTKNLFQIVFDWLYPDMFNIMMRAVEEWSSCPEVMTPIFRLLAELCQNRQQRLKFEMSSCSAVLLFKEASKIICAYVPFYVLETSTVTRFFESLMLRYPDMFNIMMRAVEEWSSCPEKSRFTHRVQVMTPIFRLLAELCQNRQQRLKFEMSSCSAVLLFKEASKIICAYGNRILVMPDVPKERAYAERYKNIGIIFNVLKCALIGAYVPFGVFRLYGDPCLQDSLNMFVKLFMKIPEEDFHILTSMMTSLMFGEVKCQWSISRPLLGLILLQEEVFTNFKREIISQQPEDRHAAFDQATKNAAYPTFFDYELLQAFIGLMDGVELSLSVKNKDIFTQNLAKFRREIVEAVKGKEVSPSVSNNDMC